jgi:hypothetical protein
MVNMSKRNFISIYFPEIDEEGNRKTKNVSVPFNTSSDNELYEKVKEYSTTELKKMIAIHSYNQLDKTAKNEKRKITDLIKLRLKDKLFGDSDEISKTITFKPKHIKNWIRKLDKIDKKNKFKKLKHFLQQLV